MVKRYTINRFSLFGVDAGKTNDHLTVWFRVRELKK